MPNTWAAGMNSWLHTHGMRRETPGSAVGRRSTTVKPSIISDADMAWLLADTAAHCLTGHDRTMTFVELGCQEYHLVINRILDAVPSCRMALPENVLDALSRWLAGYVGSPEEPRLRTQLAEIRARQLEPIPSCSPQVHRVKPHSTAMPAHSVTP